MTTRNVRPFVHLRVLSSYSLGLGLSSPGDMCAHARRSGFGAVALTDVSGTYGFVEFHRAASHSGIKPIYGTLVFLDWNGPGEAGEPVQSLIVLALDRTGLRNVCAIASASAARRERREAFFVSDVDEFSEGVVGIVRVDASGSEVTPRHVLTPLHEILGDRLFVECHAGLPAAHRAAQKQAMADAAGLGISCVLTQDVRFVGPARPQLLDLMASLDEPGFEHRVFSDRRAGDASADHGMATASEISASYDEFPEAYTNASLIASLVQPDLFALLEESPGAPSSNDMFVMKSRGDLPARIRALNETAARGLSSAQRNTVRARVEHELELIQHTGLEATLTRFERLVALLREIGARLGPATGLSVQSRCAYLLGITSFDPYAVDGAFEPAFEARETWGSVFDIQISPEDRPAVLAIVNRAFSGASVGYVPGIEHLTAARSMRLVARRMDTPPAEIEEALRTAGRFHGLSLRELAEQIRSFGALYRRSAAFRNLVAHAASVEGLPFGFVRSKRTVVVSPRPLRDFFASTVSPTSGDQFIQAPRDGFPLGAVLRIDLSLLRMLAILPAGDPGVASAPAYAIIGRGDLDGIHLLEGAQGRLAPSFGIESFSDLVNFVALMRWRGSDMSLGERLAAFREPGPALPAADSVGSVVSATHGWLLFRDQLRDVAAGLAGWSRSEATSFIDHLADRSPGNLAALRREFFKRTVEQSVSLEDATEWFTRLVHAWGHALDRQRVIADCLLTERCLVLKAANRDEFMRRVADEASAKRVRFEPPSRVSTAGGGKRTETPDPGSPADHEGETGPLFDADEASPGSGIGQQADLLIPAREPVPAPPNKVRNLKRGFLVVTPMSEFYPHPTSTPVELAGRIRNLQTFSSSSGKKVGYFELIDSSGSVRVYVPAEPLARFELLIKDGEQVVVRGAVRRRDGRKVCDALEITEGGIDLGEKSADSPSTGDP